jgi:hypothetical protein
MDGDNLYHQSSAWNAFMFIYDELTENGEKPGYDFFTFKRGDRKSILEYAVQHNQLPQIFKLHVWEGRPDEMMALFSKLGEEDRKKVDIRTLLSEVSEKKYADIFAANDNVTLEKLSEALDVIESPFSGKVIVRPLGLKSVWLDMGEIRDTLLNRGEKITLSMLREKTGFMNDTCFAQAVRFGCIDDVIAIIKESGETLTADDLLTKNSEGRSALDILVEREECDKVFQAALWTGKPAEFEKVYKEIPFGLKEQMTDACSSVISRINIQSIRVLPLVRQDFERAKAAGAESAAPVRAPKPSPK